MTAEKEIKAITDELFKGLGDKITYLICTYQTAVGKQTQTNFLEENSFLVRIKFKQKEQLKAFCKENDINLNTYKVVISGHGTSTRITNILKKHKYIKSANELKKVA